MSRAHPVVYRAVAEPTIFMDAKSKRTVRYFATRRRAWRWARRYCRRNPCAEVAIEHRRRAGAAQ